MSDPTGRARRTCATMPHHFSLAGTDAVYRANRRSLEASTKAARMTARAAIVRIPVVVHVLYNTDAENLDQAQIDAQIAALNRDFRMLNTDRDLIPEPFQVFAADTLIEFALAVRDPQGTPTSGVTRTHTSKTSFPYDPNDREATRKLDALVKFDGFGRAAWPRESYLNIWTCTIDGGLLGYAQFPGGPAATDGVVIRNTAFGSGGIAAAPYDLGRTAVHEIGHWLNLLHIWGDEGGCTGSDNVGDTPNQAGSNGSEVRLSDFPRITCGNGPHGDMFMNYMDYVDDDTMIMWTKGQLARMNVALSGARPSLATSAGLQPVETPRLVPDESGAPLSAIDEHGTRPTLEFDGVSWVPAT